jgi:hypothetical protein
MLGTQSMIDALHRLLPASVAIVKGIGTLTADNVLKALTEQRVTFRYIRLGSADWEIEASDLTDDGILKLLHMEEAGHRGELLICTEACTRYECPPFRCNATELAAFISEYKIECFFDGDVILLAEESRTISVYHHAGGYTHVRL